MSFRLPFQTLGIIGLFATIITFYMLGGSAFPDYENYVTLASNGGWLFNEDEYLFEWLSRGILIFTPKIGLSLEHSVDILTAINQLFCFGVFASLIASRKKTTCRGGVLLFCLVGFLLLTTTIRASPAYLSLTLIYLRGMKVDAVNIFIVIFALAWHDSFLILGIIILVATLTTMSQSLQKALERLHFNNVIIGMAAIILLASTQLRDIILGIANVSAGIRTVYFEGDGAHSTTKLIFCLIAYLMCVQSCLDTSLNLRIRRSAALLAFCLSTTYLVSGTVAVRFSIYIFCAFIPLRGVYISKMEHRRNFQFVELILCPCLLAFNAFETLRQTA